MFGICLCTFGRTAAAYVLVLLHMASSATQANFDKGSGEGAEEGFQRAFKSQRHVTDIHAWAPHSAPTLSASLASASQPASGVLLVQSTGVHCVSACTKGSSCKQADRSFATEQLMNRRQEAVQTYILLREIVLSCVASCGSVLTPTPRYTVRFACSKSFML